MSNNQFAMQEVDQHVVQSRVGTGTLVAQPKKPDFLTKVMQHEATPLILAAIVFVLILVAAVVRGIRHGSSENANSERAPSNKRQDDIREFFASFVPYEDFGPLLLTNEMRTRSLVMFVGDPLKYEEAKPRNEVEELLLMAAIEMLLIIRGRKKGDADYVEPNEVFRSLDPNS